MGVTVRCGKKSMNMSYGQFDSLRVKIAKQLDNAFGEAYENLIFGRNNNTVKKFENICNSTENLTDEIFDFLMASDCEGSIAYTTSAQLIPLINSLGDLNLGYAAIQRYTKDDLIDFLKYSIRYRAYIRWC